MGQPRGPLPKASTSRERDERKREHAPVELGSAGAEGPERGGGRTKAEWSRLHKRTRAWWRAWRRSPQASQFTALDWERLGLVVLPLVEAFHRADDAGDAATLRNLAAELRLQEAAFGGTPADRLRLRWVVRRPAGPEPAPEEAGPVKRKPGRRRRAASADPRLRVVKDEGR